MSTTLQIGGGAPKTLDDHGFCGAVLTLTQFGLDTLKLTISRPFELTPIIEGFEKCILRVDGDVRFVGWRDAEPSKVSAESERMEYVLSGPWRLLERKPFKGDNKVGAGIVGTSSGMITLGAKWVSTVVGEETVITTSKVTIEEQLVEILDFARASTGNAFDYNLDDLPAEFLDYDHVNEERVDDYPGVLVRALLGYAPGTVMWWTYEDGEDLIPILNFGDSATMEIARTLTVATLLQTPVQPMDSSLAATIEVVYLHRVADVTTRTVHTINPAGDALIVNNSLLSSDVDRDALYSFSIGDQAVPDVKFAEALGRWAQRLHITGTPQFLGLTWGRLPGEQWTFGGKFARYAGKRATCQQVVRDIFRRVETVVLGAPPPPALLGKRVNQSTPESTDATPGTGGGGGGGGGEEETGTVNVRIFGLPSGLISTAVWTVGESGGTGENAVDLPAGTYSAVFEFVFDTANGKLYVAPPKSVEVVAEGSVNADADYEEIDLGNNFTHPFYPALKNVGTSEAPSYEVTIGQGNLYKGLGNWSTEEITGLGEARVVVENDYVWITGTYSGGELDSVEVGSGSALPGRIVISTGGDPEQTSWTTRICRIVTDGAGGLKVERNVFQHLTLMRDCVSVPVVYPFPVS